MTFIPFSDPFQAAFDNYTPWDISSATFGEQSDFDSNGIDIGWDRVPKSS